MRLHQAWDTAGMKYENDQRKVYGQHLGLLPMHCLQLPLQSCGGEIGAGIPRVCRSTIFPRIGSALNAGSAGPVRESRGMIQVKRIYDAPGEGDGFRVLVERLWPRGMRKDQAMMNLCMRDAGASPALRKWFGHDPAKWEEFQEK